MEYAGYIASVFIGISLGLIGGGGSILTVPMLVYLFSLDAVSATASSLFIVGVTSLVGSVDYYRNKLTNLKVAVVFGIPSIIAVFLTRALIVPAIPKTLLTIGSLSVTKHMFLLLLFALLMIASSYSMIKKQPESNKSSREIEFNYLMIIAEGTIVGILTGLVGAGGGFLIIPALVLLAGLPMKEAVGTSLLIIAAKSLIGFAGESGETVINWVLLGSVSVASIAGIFIGAFLAKKIDGKKLKPAFGWFVLFMGFYILIKEIFFSVNKT